MTETFPEFAEPGEAVSFRPTRAAGLKRLEQFASRTGPHYARMRNYDYGPERRSNVSALSPWLRHRLVTEQEVLTRILAVQSPSAAEKYVQEVFWRTYFKGWLEQRPDVWSHYQRDLLDALETLERDAEMRAIYDNAVCGQTGIDCLDHWAHELVTTGYLHNHARMWFASIWIFTLRLPWQLGADFFLRHLLDGDPASNTLSWRWVGGLHTKGKTYLARPDNIAKYTEGRFRPKGLATHGDPLVEHSEPLRRPIERPRAETSGPYLMLLTEDDLCGFDLGVPGAAGCIGLLATHGRSPNPVGQVVQDFAMGAMNSVLPSDQPVASVTEDWFEPLEAAARAFGVTSIVTAYIPTGPAKARLDRAEPKLREAGLTVTRVMRPYDHIVWPHAKAGFFGLKKQIPKILPRLDLR